MTFQIRYGTPTYQVLFIYITKGEVVQKILSGQMFPEDLNPQLHYEYDRDLDSNPKLSHNTDL